MDGLPPARNDADARRALWRSRRGMLELDLLLRRFAERRYRGLSKANQHAYLELLRVDDWVIWDWLRHARAAPSASGRQAPRCLAGIVTLIAAEADAQGEEDGG